MGLFSRGPNPEDEARWHAESAPEPEPVRPPEPIEPPSVDSVAESAPTVEPGPVAVEVTEPEPAPAVRPFAPVTESMPDPADEDDLRITASEAIKPKRDLTPKPADPEVPTKH